MAQYSENDLIQEEIITFPERLLAVLQSCEILGLGWTCQKEGVALHNEDGEQEETAIHFRFRVYPDPVLVPANVIEEY